MSNKKESGIVSREEAKEVAKAMVSGSRSKNAPLVVNEGSTHLNPAAMMRMVKMVDLVVERMEDDVKLPIYATAGSMAMDIFAYEWELDGPDCLLIRTGLKFEIPQGWGMFINSRSGHGFKHKLRLVNCQGWIDSDYRGEVMVKIICDSTYDASALFAAFNKDTRVAQFILQEIPVVKLVEGKVSESGTRSGGFGSSGGTGVKNEK